SACPSARARRGRRWRAAGAPRCRRRPPPPDPPQRGGDRRRRSLRTGPARLGRARRRRRPHPPGRRDPPARAGRSAAGGGGPRQDEAVARRLELLAELVTGGTSVPGPVQAAVVHGELLALRAFGPGDGVIARAAARLTMIATGLDPKGLAVPEVAFFRRLGT